MKVAITSLKNDIMFAKNYIENNNIKGIELDLKERQIKSLENAIKILENSERQTKDKTPNVTETKA